MHAGDSVLVSRLDSPGCMASSAFSILQKLSDCGGLQVSGAVDGVFEMGSEGQKRSACLAEAQASAHAKAVQAGADPSTCQARIPTPPLPPPPPPPLFQAATPEGHKPRYADPCLCFSVNCAVSFAL